MSEPDMPIIFKRDYPSEQVGEILAETEVLRLQLEKFDPIRHYVQKSMSLTEVDNLSDPMLGAIVRQHVNAMRYELSKGAQAKANVDYATAQAGGWKFEMSGSPLENPAAPPQQSPNEAFSDRVQYWVSQLSQAVEPRPAPNPPPPNDPPF